MYYKFEQLIYPHVAYDVMYTWICYSQKALVPPTATSFYLAQIKFQASTPFQYLIFIRSNCMYAHQSFIRFNKIKSFNGICTSNAHIVHNVYRSASVGSTPPKPGSSWTAAGVSDKISPVSSEILIFTYISPWNRIFECPPSGGAHQANKLSVHPSPIQIKLLMWVDYK